MARDDVTEAIRKAEQRLFQRAPLESGLAGTDPGTPDGVAVFVDVENNENLSEAERQEVYQNLAQSCVEFEIEKTPEGQATTLMRETSPQTQFLNAYLERYAAEYKQAVLDTVKKEALKIRVPNDPELKNRFPGAGDAPEDHPEVKRSTMKSLDQSFQDLGNKIIRAHTDSLDKLSSEARDFLNAAAQSASGQNQATANTMLSSTIMLKFTSPAIAMEAAAMKGADQTQMQGNVMMQANKTFQAFANAINEKPGAQLEDKPVQRAGAKLLTAANLDAAQGAFKAITQGGHELDQYLENRSSNGLQQTASSKNHSVRDSVRNLVNEANLKQQSFTNRIKDKIDDGRIMLLNKQLDKRENHGIRLIQERAPLLQEKLTLTLERKDVDFQLNGPSDSLSSLATGDKTKLLDRAPKVEDSRIRPDSMLPNTELQKKLDTLDIQVAALDVKIQRLDQKIDANTKKMEGIKDNIGELKQNKLKRATSQESTSSSHSSSYKAN